MFFSINCLEIKASKDVVKKNGHIYKNLMTEDDFSKSSLPKRFFFNNLFEKEFGEGGNLILQKEKRCCSTSFFGDKINIQAIVGKNGAGKTSVLDLMYMAINNFSYMFERGNDRSYAAELYYVQNLYLNLYFSIDDESHILSCNGDKISLDDLVFEIDKKNRAGFREKYEEKEDKYKGISDTEMPEKLRNFFYTIVSNYSLQSFISSNYICEVYVHKKDGEKQWDEECTSSWIDSIFHKNDGYKRSIVLNPYRNYGKIDMENELELSKDRFIALMVQDKEIDDVYSLEKIEYNFSDYKEKDLATFFAKIIPLECFETDPYVVKNREKINNLHTLESYEKEAQDIRSINANNRVFFDKYLNDKLHCDSRFDLFNVSILQNSPREKKICLLYLYKKICQIVLKYSEYSKYIAFSPFDIKGDIKENGTVLTENQLNELINNICNGKSHIELKAKRALNFLKLSDEKIRELAAHSEFDINAYLEKHSKTESLKLDDILEYLPPPIYNKKIILKNKKKNVLIDFKQLSSGEHQKYQTISTHLYHLMNLISVQKSNESNGGNRLAYKYVNLVFDEIEVCFHPEYQRTIVNTLLQMIKVRKINEKCEINIFLITHSPFILSDIPSSNVLFLKEGEQDYSEKERRTFAENIGEMFYDSFFMEHTIGAFAEWKLKELIKKKQGKESKIADDEEAKYILDCIGDSVIRSLIDEVEPLEND